MLLWLQRTSAALLACCLLACASPAFAVLTIPANTWVKQPTPSQVGLSGFTGTFQGRGWSHMLFDAVGHRMILWDGYVDAAHPYSIYANALWTYDVLANRLFLEKVNNWTRVNGVTQPLPANTTDPTPWDRHSYAHIAFAPETNRLYLWSGANSSITDGWIGDTWIYDFALKKWRQVSTATWPYTVFEQAMTYDPNSHRLVLFGGAASGYQSGTDAWLFDVNSELWEKAPAASQPAPRMGQAFVYDATRRVSYMFGGGSPYPSAGNEMWVYDASARTWQKITPATPPPSIRRMASLAYDSRHDLVMLWGGQVDNTGVVYNDTWIYRPSTRQWQQLFPPASPPGSTYSSEDLAYDSDNDLFILHQGGDFWLYRYASSSDVTAPADVSDLKIR